jgi:glycosyltransferase involved in cell wall biosynthesis
MANARPLPRIAIVVPNISDGGGVPAVAIFLHRIIESSGIFRADLVSVATSAKDASSVRLLSPSTWFNGVQAVERQWESVRYHHFGAVLAEIEFQRYQPRRILTDVLNEYDLIQVVSGSPAWALVTQGVRPATVLQAATLIRSERETRLREERGAVALWRRAMTGITARLDYRALRHVEAVFVENNWMWARLKDERRCKEIIFAPPGVDTSVFFPGETRTDDSILCVARFSDPRKNLRLLFTAYRQLRDGYGDAPRLVLAGKSGPTSADWNMAKSLGIAEHVDVRSNVTASELGELYRNAALFVLSSNEEGLGLVLLEAMASATPVVSTRCGGPETVVVDGETGFLTPVGDSRALADRMRQLLESSRLRREMGAAGRRTIESKYSYEVAGRVFLNKYVELLSRRGWSRSEECDEVA